MGEQEFVSRIAELLPEASKEAMRNWRTYAGDLDKDGICPKGEFYRDLYIELDLVKQHYGQETALQLFNLGESFCLNPFEVRGSANFLAEGHALSEVPQEAIDTGLDRSAEEWAESDKAVQAFNDARSPDKDRSDAKKSILAALHEAKEASEGHPFKPPGRGGETR